MKVEELTNIIFDKIVIYRSKNGDYKDIYKGEKDNIPSNILAMNVRAIGAKRRGIVDVQVFD